MLKIAKTKKREPIVETSIWGVPVGVMLLSLVTCKYLYIKIVSFQKFTIQRWEGAYNITNTKIGWVLKLHGCWIRKVCPANPEGAKERWKGDVM